jgi:zinc/manganese transport system substrate-binding protein
MWGALVACVVAGVVAAGASGGPGAVLDGAVRAGASGGPGAVLAVGAENEYANVISQIGGHYVDVKAIMSNPNTDPHEFEASASVATLVSQARLVVQNGMGYDSFMGKIEAASPSTKRLVVVAQDVVRVKAAAQNPHLWYDPKTMPAVARAVATDLAKLEPSHSAYFKANLRRFDRSLGPWLAAIANFRSRHRGAPVAVTEPVADYMLQAAGADIKTPDALQSAIMNGTDPSPQDISIEEGLIQKDKVKAFLYNRQVTDSFTATLLSMAKKSGVPVVAVYETMPRPRFDYQSWMLAEVQALTKAVASGKSTLSL